MFIFLKKLHVSTFVSTIQLLFVLFSFLNGLLSLDGGTSIFKAVMGKNGHKRRKRRANKLHDKVTRLSENGHRAETGMGQTGKHKLHQREADHWSPSSLPEARKDRKRLN